MSGALRRGQPGPKGVPADPSGTERRARLAPGDAVDNDAQLGESPGSGDRHTLAANLDRGRDRRAGASRDLVAGAPPWLVAMLSRAEAIEAIAGQRFEVVVIGGGITGAGVALDAASRGYSVALLEREDYAAGTSSRSSKMVHGGLRYLQNFDLGLVREALLERQLMVRLAPHLVYPTPFLVPALGEERRDRRVGIGLNMYDVMATTRAGRARRASSPAAEEEQETSWSPDRHRTIDREEVLQMTPALAAREPSGAYLFYDCQTDDARLVLTVLGEAERFGAVMLNGAGVIEVLPRGGRASGVCFIESESGERVEVEAANVVNATGVWADRILPAELVDEEDVPRIDSQPRHPPDRQ